jgi:hypothetical protein
MSETGGHSCRQPGRWCCTQLSKQTFCFCTFPGPPVRHLALSPTLPCLALLLHSAWFLALASARSAVESTLPLTIPLWKHCQDRHELQRPTRYMPPFAHSLSRLTFGSNSHARRHSSKTFPPARRLRSPTRIFDPHVAHPSHAENAPRDPPKISLGRLPSVLSWSATLGSLRSPRLGSGDHSLLVARDRWAQKEKRNVPQSR